MKTFLKRLILNNTPKTSSFMLRTNSKFSLKQSFTFLRIKLKTRKHHLLKIINLQIKKTQIKIKKKNMPRNNNKRRIKIQSKNRKTFPQKSTSTKLKKKKLLTPRLNQ